MLVSHYNDGESTADHDGYAAKEMVAASSSQGILCACVCICVTVKSENYLYFLYIDYIVTTVLLMTILL